METQNAEFLIHENITKLSRGAMQSSHACTLEAYKNLFDVGKPIIPILKDMIFEVEWSNAKYKELSGYISVLFSLLHDIDEEEANSIGEELITNGCPDHIRAIIKTILSFSVRNYKRYKVGKLEIFQFIKIEAKCDIGYYIQHWLNNIPNLDLMNINRLYVVPREKINAAGTYTPHLNAIALLWQNDYKERSLLFKIHALIIEKVLYHEIGHHKHKHKLGTDPDQEIEADLYAFNIMRKHHPFIALLTKALRCFGLRSNRNYYRWGL